MKSKFIKLFSPVKVGNVMLKNRIISAPMGIPKATLLSSKKYGGLSVYDKSLGGCAVVTVSEYEIASLAHEDYAFSKYAKDVGREILSVLHQSGSLAQIELGFNSQPDKNNEVLAPMDGQHFTGAKAVRMTKKDIDNAIEKLANTASDAKKFGFDMVMLHFGHDSWCSQFLSPVWNQREDEYGGSLENRMRFPLEALSAVRKAVGSGFPVLMRISRNLMVKETFSEEDMLAFIKKAEKYVDIVNVSCGMDCYGGTVQNYTANIYAHTTNFLPRMHNLQFCEKVKQNCDVKVCIVGGVSDPQECEDAIAQKKIDFVMLGRQLVADPFWPRKAMNNEEDEIVPCLRCLNCYHVATEHNNTQCSVNPRFRRENRVPLKLEKADSTKNVVIVGGGPAGMKAAITAAQRGHHVILLEKNAYLGGQMKVADYDDYKSELKKYRNYLIRQVHKYPIDVRLSCSADRSNIEALNPDALIIAVGATARSIPLKGIECTIQVLDAYPTMDKIKGNVVVIGGGSIGSEFALEIAKRGNHVTLLEKGNEIAANGNFLYRLGLKQQMNLYPNLVVKTEVDVNEVTDKTVIYTDQEGKKNTVPSDYTVLAVGLTSRKDLVDSLYGITEETSAVGDCYRVASVMEATNDAYFIAANL